MLFAARYSRYGVGLPQAEPALNWDEYYGEAVVHGSNDRIVHQVIYHSIVSYLCGIEDVLGSRSYIALGRRTHAADTRTQ